MDPRKDSRPCKSCTARCCVTLPGAALPGDLEEEPSIEFFRKLVVSGDWAVDWWEGDVVKGGELPQCYYWRPAIQGVERVFHGAWGGRCSWLTPTGCKEPWEKRPAECRNLIAKDEGCCEHTNGKEMAALEWRPYQDLFEALRVELQEYVCEYLDRPFGMF